MRFCSRSITCAGLAVLAWLAGAGAAQAQANYEQRKQAKLAEAWIAKAAWITDYDKALEESKKSGKLLFAYFSRSYTP